MDPDRDGPRPISDRVANAMRGFLTQRRIAAAAIVVTVLVTGALAAWLVGRATEFATAIERVSALPADSLADEKLRDEILALELANLGAASPWSELLSIVPLTTAILGGAAVVATIWKQITERADQVRQDRAERERENLRRFAESFKTTVENLAAPEASLRATAAATLSTFLRGEYSEYHEELLLVSIAKSKEGMEKDQAVARLVVRAVELALRAELPTMAADSRRYLLDLSRCQLERIDLSGLDLHEADIAFAQLGSAVLDGANLGRARGYEVHLEGARLGSLKSGTPANLQEARLRKVVAPKAKFHQARCISMRAEEADLKAAEFLGAHLQEAHFDGADLRGATFHGANLDNAFFPGAQFDDRALTTIARGAHNWRKAHFDPDIRAQLELLSESALDPTRARVEPPVPPADASAEPRDDAQRGDAPA